MILAYTFGVIIIVALLSATVSTRIHDVPSSLVAQVMRDERTKALVYDKKAKVWRKQKNPVIK